MLLALWVISLAVLWPGRAAAQAWLRLDRVETTPSVFEGHTRLRAFVGAIELYGKRIELKASDFSLKLGSSEARAPALLTTYAGDTTPLALSIVVVTTADYADTLGELKAQLKTFVQALPKDSQVSVVGYSESLTGGHRVTDAATAVKQIERLDPELVADPPDLIGAVERAVRAVKRAKPPEEGAALRKLIVVVSDGKDADPDPERYRRVAKLAAREGIPIHSVAFSPQNHRRPMLGLGEMSKRSNGTFRLILTLAGAQTQFENLLAEINEQYVLTYYLPNGTSDGKRVRVLAKDLESNEVKAEAPTCGGQTCDSGSYCVSRKCTPFARDGGRGILGWILLLGGGALGLLVVLVLIGYLLGRRAPKAPVPYPHPVAGPPGAAPASPPDHRIAGMAPGQQSHHVQPNAYGGIPTSGSVAAAAGAPPAGGFSGAATANNPYGGVATAGAVPAAGHGPAPAAAPRAAPAAAPRPSSLLVLSGPNQGRQFPVRHGFLMGKAPGCDLDLGADGYASGHHAQLIVDTAGNVSVMDRGSTNGTFVNGVRVSQMQLSHGMVIRVGSTDVRFLTQ